MSDVANAGSNPASEPIEQAVATPVDAAPVTAQPDAVPVKQEPAKSPREALERSFAKLEQGADAKPDKPRDPANGQFKAKEKPAADPAKTAAALENQAEPVKQPASAIAPPSRFAKQAAADWALAPESVRGEVARMEQELTQGIEKYRADAEAFEPMRKYNEIAKQNGVKLEHAMQNYLELDHAWATNPVQGFLQTCAKTRVDPRELISAVVNGGQLQQPQADPRDGIIRQLLQKVDALEGGVTQVRQTVEQQQQQHAYNQTLNEVQAFAKDHPYFDELLPAMTQMVETKFAKDLSDAYDKAVRLNPEVFARIEADKAARQPKQPGSNPKAALSISGSPAGGSNPTTKPAGSPREALTRAFAQLGAA